MKADMPTKIKEEWYVTQWMELCRTNGQALSINQILEKIVAEAERRGKVNAYEDVLSAASQLRRDLQCMCAVKIPTCGCINDSFNEALDELGKAINEELIVTL